MADWKLFVREHPRVGPWFRQIEGRPGWVIKAALAAAGLVIVVPLVILSLGALVVGVLVFAVLGFVGSVIAAVTGRLGKATTRSGPGLSERLKRAGQRGGGGRKNVRVLRR